MKLTSRRAHGFITVEVDEIKTTIFNDSQNEIKDTINNLLSVVDDLASRTELSIEEHLKNYLS